jgi:hypothetical protein
MKFISSRQKNALPKLMGRASLGNGSVPITAFSRHVDYVAFREGQMYVSGQPGAKMEIPADICLAFRMSHQHRLRARLRAACGCAS